MDPSGDFTLLRDASCLAILGVATGMIPFPELSPSWVVRKMQLYYF